MNRLILPVAWAPRLSPAAGAAAGCAEAGSGGPAASFQWVLQRRASMSPRQLITSLGLLMLVTGAVALFFWLQGARLVTAFAGLELLAVAAAFGWHALHAADGETLSLRAGRLHLERRSGLRCTRAVVKTDWLQLQWSASGMIELHAGRQHHLVGGHVDGARRQHVMAELRQALAHLRAADRTPE